MLTYLFPDDEPGFPDPGEAEDSGILAVGGALTPDWLVTAYSQGVFPWYSEGTPILWWSPDPRLVLELDRFKVNRALRKTIKKGVYQVRYDTAFREVITRCGAKDRPGQDGTWITTDMIEAYVELHRLGFAHSVESWADGQLAGGLYGVSLGGMYFGESMFTDRTDASKVALAHLVARLKAWDFDLIDCQVETEHLLSLGAEAMPREVFLGRVALALDKPTRRGSWTEAVRAK